MKNPFEKNLIVAVFVVLAAVSGGWGHGALAEEKPGAGPGPRGPAGPDVPLTKAEKMSFEKRVTVDGRTDEAVRAACRLAVKKKIATVFLPAGQYEFGKTVKVSAGLTILGEGSKTCCRTKTNSVHLFKAVGDNVRFTRLKLQGADTTTDNSNNSYGIIVSGVNNVRIDHCELLGFSYATTFSGEAVAMLDHCKVHHNLRNGLGYGVALYSGAKVLICDNEFRQNRHSLASNGALDWSSPKRVGKFLHKKGVDKTHWEFIHNLVGCNNLSNYELCAVDTHPGMDGTFVVENNIFENLRHAIGIRDGAGVIRRNLFRKPHGKSWRKWYGITIRYGTHNRIPVENAMPHHIEVAENTFLNVSKKYKKYDVGKSENITVDGKLLPKTKSDNKWDLTFAKMPRLEVGKDGKLHLRRNTDRRVTVWGKGKVAGKVLDSAGKAVTGATVHLGVMSAATDAQGRFAFENVTAGKRFLVVTKPKFETAIAGFSITAGKSSDVVVRLKPDGKKTAGNGGAENK